MPVINWTTRPYAAKVSLSDVQRRLCPIAKLYGSNSTPIAMPHEEIVQRLSSADRNDST